tara:strand:- start:2125 stop:3261 length:1137 start_codon:yes stop_codon:yes gene_type:complete
MKYCINCILPSSRPNLFIDNKTNLCSVCEPLKDKKNKINWKKRRIEFESLVYKIKKNRTNYDCLIPVSGGKDSTWQVITALSKNLKPLCITWKSPARNSIGKENLENLIKLGVDHIDFSVDPQTEKYFTLKAFKKFGSPLIPMHMALHSLAVKTAIEKKIKYIFWGENSADEYGGKHELKGKYMTNNWRRYYGVFDNTNINNWADKKINLKKLLAYKLPNQKEIYNAKIKEIFLGYYFKWDPKKIYKISKKFGFKKLKKPKTGIYNFADIDDEFLITIHHYLKWHKFGFTRMWDNLSIEIRNGRISRPKAIYTVKKIGYYKPKKEIQKFCDYLKISNREFKQICNKFRNKKIWFKNKKNKKWQIKGFLINNWNWKNEN